jgi:hypothetical protein
VYIKLTIIDSEASVESPPSKSPPSEYPPSEYPPANSLIGMAFLIPYASIVHLMHSQIIIRIVSQEGLILAGYIQQLKSRMKI